MQKIRVVYICHFSTSEIRSFISLKSFNYVNFFRKLLGYNRLDYNDSGVWNADFIRSFENNDSFECYVISHHLGMKRKKQVFQKNGITYIFLREKYSLWNRVVDRLKRRNNDVSQLKYCKQITNEIERLSPDIAVVCGAENLIYSPSVLDIKDKPVFVILQTLLNSRKRVEMGIGSAIRRDYENKIIRHSHYFGTFNLEEVEYIKSQNKDAYCLKQIFPSSVYKLKPNTEKEYDFVFFANGLTKNKGIEDLLKAFGIVCMSFPDASLCVIGSCNPEYKQHLDEIISRENITDNVSFFGHFPKREDAFMLIQKARCAVLPGITAALNSTVREAMLLGIPVIMYQTPISDYINSEGNVLVTAIMEDPDDLANKMAHALENRDDMNEIGKRGKQFAESFFSPEAVKKVLINNMEAIFDNYYHNTPISQGLIIS